MTARACRGGVRHRIRAELGRLSHGFRARPARAALLGIGACVGLFSVALAQEPPTPAFEVLGETIQPGELRRLGLETSESFAGVSVSTPVTVAHGAHPGPVLCLTAGIHGDELNGVEIVRRVVERIDPTALSGTVVAVPLVNPHGFRRSSRYLPDRRDLNRYFPGNRLGSSASRIAYHVFESIIRHCELLVDFHTGSFHRTNLPQIRADVRNPALLRLARRFGASIVLHNKARQGTLRYAANEIGVLAITYEAGEPMRLTDSEIEPGVEGTLRLIAGMRQTLSGTPSGGTQEVYQRSSWVRVNEGGILIAAANLGDWVDAGTILGAVTDPITNEKSFVAAPRRGRVIGKAFDQVVIPGFAAFHLASKGLPVELLDSDTEIEAAEQRDLDVGDNIEFDERPE